MGFAALAVWLGENEITSVSCVPTVFRRVAGVLKPGERLPRLRLIKLTGETINRSDVDLFRKHFSPGCRLRVSLGTTETGTITARVVDHHTQLEDGILASGFPVPGKEVLVLDEAGKPVALGEAGEIAVRSRFIASGYWQQPESTASRFLSDPADPHLLTYLTGDRGCIRVDGMVVHLGRGDNQVKIHGNRVELADVEAALLRLEGISEGAVAAQEGTNGEKYLVAYCVLPMCRRYFPRTTCAARWPWRCPILWFPQWQSFCRNCRSCRVGKWIDGRLPNRGAMERVVAPDIP